ncbi:MAG: hypothetical protein ACYDDV_02020 [Methanoregula sp.]
MNTNVRYAILAVLIIAILLAFSLTTSNPLIYSLEKDTFPSMFHENREVLKQQSQNSTTDIVPEIQDFIDFSGPVSLNIRIHDIEQARRDLERFGKSRGSIKNLIVRLDMNESEIQKIEENTAMQKEILESLLNTSASLDSLQLMEIQYNSQNNQDMLTTVRLKGDELRKKVRGLKERYTNATENIAAASTKLGLDATKNKESQSTVEQIVEEIERPKTTSFLPVDTSLTPGEDRVSLFLKPESGKYLDIIEYMGISLTLRGNTTLRAENKPIILYLDDQPVSTTVTDIFGYYNVKLPLERINAGTHTLYARSPTSRSVNRTLTVIPVDSVTNLTISKPDQNGNVNCSGSVMANHPVRSATIQISWDKTHVIVTKTDAYGQFFRQLQLPAGRHTVIAGFSGDGYPVNPSESEPRIVDVSLIPGIEPDYGLAGLIISLMVIVILFLGVAVFYLRRMTRKKIPEPGTSRNADPVEESELPGTDNNFSLYESEKPYDDTREPGKETLVEYYTRLLNEQGLSAASRKVYEQLTVRIVQDFHIKRYKTLTAREISRNCRGKPYCGSFARFISIYERIRYGGNVSVKDQAIFETAMNSTDDLMGGENH